MKIIIAIGPHTFIAHYARQMPTSQFAGGNTTYFTDPHFTIHSQSVINKRSIGATQEKGMAVCGWKRPTKK